MAGSTLDLSPEFAGSAGAEPPSTPIMEGVRGLFNQAGSIGSEVVDIAMSPAARPWMGGLMGIMALTLAWKFAPMLTDKLVPGNGMMSKFGGGLLALGIALSAGMGAFELGNTGFDLGKTAQNLKRNVSVAGEMAGSALKGADNLVTGGRVRETGVAIGEGLVAADDATGNVVSGAGEMVWEMEKKKAEFWQAAGGIAVDTAADVGGAALDALDSAIDHKPPRPGR